MLFKLILITTLKSGVGGGGCAKMLVICDCSYFITAWLNKN